MKQRKQHRSADQIEPWEQYDPLRCERQTILFMVHEQ